jgi:flavin-dependent thymidylate synthase
MKVTLISYTPDAENLLMFTKATRLTMSPGLLDEIRAKPKDEKMAELEYMANTIPSSWEFVDYVFLVEGVSRAYTHQQVRTRQASYAQQTMRVLNMGEFDYIHSDKIKADPAAMDAVNQCLAVIKHTYNRLLEMGHAVEDARGVLPTNISTNIVCKFNLRTFVDLAKSRTGGRTQSEYQQVVNAMVDAVLAVHPWAEKFLFQEGRDYFAEIEAFAQREYGGDLLKKGALLKIVDKMRKEAGQ